MAKEIPVTQARADLADLVNRVGYSGERIVLTRHGRALAAIVSVADLEALEALERPNEIGFRIARAVEEQESASAEKPVERRPAPMRIAAELRDPRDPRRPGR